MTLREYLKENHPRDGEPLGVYYERIAKEFNSTPGYVRKVKNAVAKKEGIDKSADNHDLDLSNVKHGWIKDKGSSLFFINPDFEVSEFDYNKIDWDSIIKGLQLPTLEQKEPVNVGIFDRLVFTDVHVGMNPNPNGNSQYGGVWDEKELMKRAGEMIKFVVQNRKSGLLIIDDLGDLPDGWDSKTARKQHELPQNMTNEQIFETAIKFKTKVVSELSQYYNNVYVHSVCNDNHGGDFTGIINNAFKALIHLMCANVDAENYHKFINHYSVGKNVFIVCHGKDSKHLKFGFTPQLDQKQTEKISDYIDDNFLLQKGVNIEFSKGDSHQMLFNWDGSTRFNYFNYPAFSPASDWVQTNYKKSAGGFVFFNYISSENYVIKPYHFKWKY